MMTRAQDFDREIENECGRMYNLRSREELSKFQRKLITSVKYAKKGMEQAGNARAALSPHDSRARITKANARYHTAAEHFERESKHLAYVNAALNSTIKDYLIVAQTHDALFDGSDAHLLNDAGDAFEPDALAQADAACGVSPGAMGSASGNNEERT